jgi:hypothetical protein
LKPTNPTDDSSDPAYLASHSYQLAKRFDDNRNVAPCRLAMTTGEMAHRDFFDRHAKPRYLRENFSVDHCAHGLNLDLIENAAIKNFEGTINVADPDPKHEPHENIPTPGKQQSVGWVLSPRSITSNDIVGIRLFDECSQLFQIKLSISVAKEN